MSDTPRTDGAAIRCACSTYVVPSEFARELERENAALRADLLIEEERSIYWRDNEGKAMAENAAMREAALFLLNEIDGEAFHQVGEANGEMLYEGVGKLRAAIDAVKKEAGDDAIMRQHLTE